MQQVTACKPSAVDDEVIAKQRATNRSTATHRHFKDTRRTPRISGLGQMSPERIDGTEPLQDRPAPRCQTISKGTFGCPFFSLRTTHLDEAGEWHLHHIGSLYPVARRIVCTAAHRMQGIGMARVRRPVRFRQVRKLAIEYDERTLWHLKPFQPAHVPVDLRVEGFHSRMSIRLFAVNGFQSFAMLARQSA